MILLDKLSQRGLRRGIPQSGLGFSPPSRPRPVAEMATPINTQPVKPLTTTPLSERLGAISKRGAMGSMPELAGIKKRFIADLPANVQLKGIAAILAGQDTNSPIVNNFVRGLAAQGKQPEQIRQAFIAQQKTSPNPLILM